MYLEYQELLEDLSDDELGQLMRAIFDYEKEVYLVLSATTKYRDLLEIADIYKKETEEMNDA